MCGSANLAVGGALSLRSKLDSRTARGVTTAAAMVFGLVAGLVLLAGGAVAAWHERRARA
ncbi:hypothetical protein L1857_20260 [Amycolatopsis thermalba]|uniref:DUF4190 domain-containing protein n=1 Tax=Amycolatopsis thermalba TaxID=944492 RepID=A0ABY4NY56_9PSEU|nr:MULTISPECIES: hypothetical protein [Amycolatopsis]UQS24981.1 hypothetical protein L1857_20260 [Amycolatopsis thermalba]